MQPDNEGLQRAFIDLFRDLLVTKLQRIMIQRLIGREAELVKIINYHNRACYAT